MRGKHKRAKANRDAKALATEIARLRIEIAAETARPHSGTRQITVRNLGGAR